MFDYDLEMYCQHSAARDNEAPPPHKESSGFAAWNQRLSGHCGEAKLKVDSGNLESFNLRKHTPQIASKPSPLLETLVNLVRSNGYSSIVSTVDHIARPPKTVLFCSQGPLIHLISAHKFLKLRCHSTRIL